MLCIYCKKKVILHAKYLTKYQFLKDKTTIFLFQIKQLPY